MGFLSSLLGGLGTLIPGGGPIVGAIGGALGSAADAAMAGGRGASVDDVMKAREEAKKNQPASDYSLPPIQVPVMPASPGIQTGNNPAFEAYARRKAMRGAM